MRIRAIGTLGPHCRCITGISPAEPPGRDVVYLARTTRRLSEKAAADTKRRGEVLADRLDQAGYDTVVMIDPVEVR